MSTQENNPLIEVYGALFKSAGLDVDENDRVVKSMSEGSLPATIEIDEQVKSIALPTYPNLTSEDADKLVFFHPFKENIFNGESRLVAYLRRAYNNNVNEAMFKLMLDIVNVAIGAEVDHKTLTNAQKELLTKLGTVDSKFKDTLNTIVKNAFKGQKELFPIKITLAKGAKGKGKHLCSGYITSPLLEAVNVASSLPKPKIGTTTIRKGDIDTFKALLGLVLPKGFKDGSIELFVDISDAPIIDTLIKVMKKVPEQSNQMAKTMFGGKYPIYGKDEAAINFKESYIEVDWIDDEFEVASYRKFYELIPQQEGNEGVSNAAPTNLKRQEIKITPQPKVKPKYSVNDTPPWEEQQAPQQVQTQHGYAQQGQPEPAPKKSGILAALLPESQSRRNNYQDDRRGGWLNNVPQQNRYDDRYDNRYPNNPRGNYYGQSSRGDDYMSSLTGNGGRPSIYGDRYGRKW